MDIFKVHNEIIKDYESYINSFINIQDPGIKEVVEKEIKSKKLWPEPLIQFNPSYETGESMNELIESFKLHPEIKNIFGNYKLYKHQAEAIKLGIQDKDFILTSGSGQISFLKY